MNPIDDPRDSGPLLLGTTVITSSTRRRPGPPTEAELIRAELDAVAERRSGRRGLAGRLRAGLDRRSRHDRGRQPAGRPAGRLS